MFQAEARAAAVSVLPSAVQVSEPFALIIFGATGALTQSKLLPAVMAVLFAVAALGPAMPLDSGKDKPLKLKIPEALRARHEAFHAEFSRATTADGPRTKPVWQIRHEKQADP